MKNRATMSPTGEGYWLHFLPISVPVLACIKKHNASNAHWKGKSATKVAHSPRLLRRLGPISSFHV